MAFRLKEKEYEFITNSGKTVILKWEGKEYRAYLKKGMVDLKKGAMVPEGLIEYLKKEI